MRQSIYDDVKKLALQYNGNEIQIIRDKYPDIEFDTIQAIVSQENSRKIRLNHHKYRALSRIQDYIQRYSSGEDILAICISYDVPPCLMARFLLEHLAGVSRSSLGACIKDPSRLPIGPYTYSLPSSHGNQSVKKVEVSADRLREDVHRCADNDPVTGPAVELIRRVAGVEYEALLCKKLKEIGVPFQTEDALRAAGFSKTPDAKLEVPIAVKGRVVCWIDSKASFGDEYHHRMSASEQYQRYVNRFGPGMVIYWFGYIDELDDHPDVLLIDHFPFKEDIYCLPVLPVVVNGSVGVKEIMEEN